MRVAKTSDRRKLPAFRPRSSAETSPARNEPATPTPIVARMPIGSGPGSAKRARAPMMSPLSASTRRNVIIVLLLPGFALEKLRRRAGRVQAARSHLVEQLLDLRVVADRL